MPDLGTEVKTGSEAGTYAEEEVGVAGVDACAVAEGDVAVAGVDPAVEAVGPPAFGCPSWENCKFGRKSRERNAYVLSELRKRGQGRAALLWKLRQQAARRFVPHVR